MRNCLNTYVSFYSSITCRYPVKAELYDLLTTDRFEYMVTEVRNEKDENTRKIMKNRLPAFTTSGLFNGSRADTLIKSTGLICIDIDIKDNRNVEDYDNLKERLGKLPFIAFCGRSVGGDGYYAIIPIAHPDKLLYHFRNLQAIFTAMGITIDPACCDISRKRFVSYDPEPYINQEAVIYEELAEELPAIIQVGTAEDFYYSGNDSELKDIVLKYIHIIEERGVDITSGWTNWFRVGCALHNGFGEPGRQLFHRVSQFYDGYNYKDTDKLYSSISKGKPTRPITIKTFLKYAREYNVDVYLDFGDYE